jgi:hypothetical protein
VRRGNHSTKRRGLNKGKHSSISGGGFDIMMLSHAQKNM